MITVRPNESLRSNLPLAFTMLLCTVLILLRVDAAVEGSTMSGHKDETYVYRASLRVLTGPDLNPEFFTYPSLPFYLTAAGLKAGILIEDPEPYGKQLIRVPNRQGEPHEPHEIFAYPRALFGLIGALIFLLVAVLTAQLAGSYTWAWLAPGILAFSELLQFQVAKYQNVDGLVAFFTTATIVAVLYGWNKNSLWKRVVLPGVLAGLATACKYNSGLILVPCALAIVLAPGAMAAPWRIVREGLLLGLCAAAAFFAVVPYAILDFQGFYEGVSYQLRHYTGGHPGYDGPTGITQILFYLNALLEEFGPVGCALAIVGVGYGFKIRPRETFLALSFPVIMILYMSTITVNFLRTVMGVFVLLPVFAALGTAGVATLVTQFLPVQQWRRFGHAGLGLVLVVGLIMTSNTAVWADRNIKPDNRLLAASWVRKNICCSTMIYLASDLWFPEFELKTFNVVRLEPELPAEQLEAVAQSAPEGSLLILTSYRQPGVPMEMRNKLEDIEAYSAQVKPRVDAVNARAQTLVEATEATLVKSWSGKRVMLHAVPGRRANANYNLPVEIYRTNAVPGSARTATADHSSRHTDDRAVSGNITDGDGTRTEHGS